MAKISARGCWEIARLVKDGAVLIIRSDGKVLYKRSTAGYTILPKTTANMAKGWKTISTEERNDRVAKQIAAWINHGWQQVACHVTYGSHEQRNGYYWANFHKHHKQ